MEKKKKNNNNNNKKKSINRPGADYAATGKKINHVTGKFCC
jgi:hypothetical protein